CFQAEDGIRDATVTGVQTCALPISRSSCAGFSVRSIVNRACEVVDESEDLVVERGRLQAWVCGECALILWRTPPSFSVAAVGRRSEERRVGKARRGVGVGGGEEVER